MIYLICGLLSTVIFSFFVFGCLKNKQAWPVFALVMLVLSAFSLGFHVAVTIIQETP